MHFPAACFREPLESAASSARSRLQAVPFRFHPDRGAGGGGDPRYSGLGGGAAVDGARVVRAQADITAIVTALNMYRLDNFDYPSTDQGLEALVKQPSGVQNWRRDGYLPSVPKDPWGREYLYLKPGAHGAFDVWSQGADGRSGGEGVASDIGNWEP